MPKTLPHYLKTYRKRLGFSQKDMAFLLGHSYSARLCRYEYFTRPPTLDVALAYMVICQAPLQELLAGLYQHTQREVAQRAQQLLDHYQRQADKSSVNPTRIRQVEHLYQILEQYGDQQSKPQRTPKS